MSTSPATVGSRPRSFPLDPKILGPNSAATLDVGATTATDVVLAILGNTPFPTRPNGVIDLAHIGLTATGGKPVAFEGGSGLTVGFEFSAGVTAGAAIFDDPNAAIAALGLDETPGLSLSVPGTTGFRYALLRTGYQASGSVSGSHPVGALGSVTFGASGAAAGISAVLHRFAGNTGADTVLGATVKSWRLPRHVESASVLEPGTWVVAEASGSLAVKIGARFGYNFNFVREVKALGLAGDIGLKIDAAATAFFGFDVSGRYLVVAGRESDDAADQRVRLRLFKLKTNGLQFGLNLKVGVTGVESILPGKADDFVQAVFGVHGAQVVQVLGQIEKWTDPKQSVGQLVAGLTNERGLALLREVTGVDPATAFNAARQKLLDAIQQYRSLPDRVASELNGLLGSLSPQALQETKDALALLASSDSVVQKKAFTGLLSVNNFSATPTGRILLAAADTGVLSLLDRLPQLRSIAGTAQSVLDGGIIAKLQKLVEDKLNLNKVLDVVTKTDFDALDSFLVGRLAAFFDKDLKFEQLKEIKDAIHAVIDKRQEIYDKAKTALNSRYGLEVAATWQRTDASRAVVDAVFDTADAGARELLKDVLTSGDAGLDGLLTKALPTVQINGAVLTHELTRKSTLEITLPRFNFQTQSVTTALANVRPEDNGGRILLYDATGSTTVSVRNRFSSSLNMTLAAAVARTGFQSPDLRIQQGDGNTWSYQLLYAKGKMKRKELVAVTRPFLTQYMADHFPGASSLPDWYDGLENSTEERLHNGPGTYGDVCASLEVTIPGSALGAWIVPIADRKAAAQRVSVAIQKALRERLPMFYLSDIAKLKDLASSAPLLAWASIPPAVKFDGTTFSETGGGDVFWDHVDPALQQAAARNPRTAAALLAMLPELRSRLSEAGLNSATQFYADSEAGKILGAAVDSFGIRLFASLMLFEALVVDKAADALKDIQKFLDTAGTSPTEAVKRLAEFAADITKAFGDLIGQSVFGSLASFRAVAEVVFAEASAALSGGAVAAPKAMLTLNILNPAPPRTFQLSDFLAGKQPAAADIALAQRLVSIS